MFRLLYSTYNQPTLSPDSYAEFTQAKETISKWGIDLSDPEAQWKECDKNGGGMVLFAEFCEWAIKKNLDLEDDDE